MDKFINYYGNFYAVKRHKMTVITKNGVPFLYTTTTGAYNWRVDVRGLWLEYGNTVPSRRGSILLVEHV
jgi:hypothetical protein